MVLSIELTPELEERFREGVALHDKSQVRDVLALAVDYYVESMMFTPPSPITEDDWDQVLDELDAFLDSILSDDIPVLSDYALSREGIYGDHP
ncbi:MAG: hypothetical protein HY741_04660 [Chloroflexi bacterium]|nr:hypothetical protein [Chloroflexota bacterium]